MLYVPTYCVGLLKPKAFTLCWLYRYYETSAASGEGVDRLFNDMLTGLIERKKLWKAKSANPSIWMMEFRGNKRKSYYIDCGSRDHGHWNAQCSVQVCCKLWKMLWLETVYFLYIHCMSIYVNDIDVHMY